jgi:DNA-binding SARP family transcriptional activator/tetratricopeptide (TPR) repeat protein
VATVLRILGEVTAEVDGEPVDLGAPRQRCVLAALAVDAGRAVPIDRLAQRVWGVDVARRAPATLHSYISRLRRALSGADGVAIVRRSGGYALVVDAGEPFVDIHRFRGLCLQAHGDEVRAAQSLTEALALWRGEALTGLDGEWAEEERDRLRQECLAAKHDLVDARLRAGEGQALVAELSARTAQHPTDERIAGQYMLALHRTGRTADALAHYRQVRTRFIEEFGTEPGADLQERHRQVLAADPALARAFAGTAAEPVPRQLPAAPVPFVGRRDELDRLDAAEATETAVIFAIAGTGGVGKTWLALHWAHRNLSRFPDGQLFVDLHGFSPEGPPMEPAVAVRGFLHALGVHPGRLPVEPHAQAALFRSVVADMRMLVVLDNAADTTQIAPLLPGGGTCTVVVTSRCRLPGLITGHGAQHVPLGFLPDAEARALLTERLGAVRARQELAAMNDLVGLCGGFPLALSIIAGHACTRPQLSLTTLAGELRALGLAVLEDSDPASSLPTVLSWSRRRLTPAQDRLFALLGIAPGADIGLSCAANLAGIPIPGTRALLRGLEQVSLITQDSSGRYGMHNLVRAYATDTARDLPDGVREAALRRVLDFCTHTAHHAGLLLDAHRGPVELAPPTPGTHIHPLSDPPAAMAWFDSERATLLAAQHLAALRHGHRTVWWLALALDTFHHRRGHRHDRLSAWRAAAHAATHLSDPAPAVIARRHLGRACAALGLYEEAVEHLHHAIGLLDEHDNPYELGHLHQTLGRALGQHDDYEALKHATRALRIFLGLDAPLCVAHGHNAVGWHTARLGDHDTARTHFQAALTLHQVQDNPAGEANSLDSLGYLEHNAGNHQLAIRHYRQALALRRGLGNAFDSASTLEHLGHPYAALVRHDQARAVWREALEIYRQQGRTGDAEQVQRKLGTLPSASENQATRQNR